MVADATGLVGSPPLVGAAVAPEVVVVLAVPGGTEAEAVGRGGRLALDDEVVEVVVDIVSVLGGTVVGADAEAVGSGSLDVVVVDVVAVVVVEDEVVGRGGRGLTTVEVTVTVLVTVTVPVVEVTGVVELAGAVGVAVPLAVGGVAEVAGAVGVAVPLAVGEVVVLDVVVLDVVGGIVPVAVPPAEASSVFTGIAPLPTRTDPVLLYEGRAPSVIVEKPSSIGM
ncbi:hypothetical protein [Austwickia chelonae]|uniref:hypothetical protein n=1 Tax=Austwickia chelonae TaxID=100225 RepID=UPI000E23AD79|nr:hypothetical protein [Austwickia chelonae]